MSRPRQARSAITKKTAKAVLVYFPPEVVALMDEICRREDTDRSKFIRNAVRQQLPAR